MYIRKMRFPMRDNVPHPYQRTPHANPTAMSINTRYHPEGLLHNTPDHTPSIRQDYDLGRSMELESMLLVPMQFAREANLDTPCLDTITALAVLQAQDKGLYTP